jgi:hypothetical protein
VGGEAEEEAVVIMRGCWHCVITWSRPGGNRMRAMPVHYNVGDNVPVPVWVTRKRPEKML